MTPALIVALHHPLRQLRAPANRRELCRACASILLSLPPMPKGAYAEVIKGPARRLEGTKRALKIEEPLVDALLADIEEGGAKDALPLLAFTLERLYREHGGDGDLKLSEYEELGRVKGSIEAAVERALKAADARPENPARPARRVLRCCGAASSPGLPASTRTPGSPRRRIARHSEIPAESRPLIDLLVEQRLLSHRCFQGNRRGHHRAGARGAAPPMGPAARLARRRCRAAWRPRGRQARLAGLGRQR